MAYGYLLNSHDMLDDRVEDKSGYPGFPSRSSMPDRAAPYAPDPRAVRLAQALLERVPADNIVIFGSRARGDWNQYSDIDLLVVQAPDSAWNCIREQAYTLARSIFGQGMDIDLVYRTHRECHMQIEYSVNGIAAVALREGVAMEPYPAPLNDPDRDPDPELTEYGEMKLRIADANDNYDVLQYALDGGRESDSVAAHAHQALEHALKALLSAQGNPYPYRRKLDELRQAAGINSLSMASDLTQLDQYAGGDAYPIASHPIRDFAAMANAVTDDLILIYARIERLTGQDAWSLQPPGIPNPIQPVYR